MPKIELAGPEYQSNDPRYRMILYDGRLTSVTVPLQATKGYPFGGNYQIEEAPDFAAIAALDPNDPAVIKGLQVVGMTADQIVRVTDVKVRAEFDELGRQAGALRSTIPGLSPGEWFLATKMCTGYKIPDGGLVHGSAADLASAMQASASTQLQKFYPDLEAINNATLESNLDPLTWNGPYQERDGWMGRPKVSEFLKKGYAELGLDAEAVYSFFMPPAKSEAVSS